jgi:hypothetical protein
MPDWLTAMSTGDPGPIDATDHDAPESVERATPPAPMQHTAPAPSEGQNASMRGSPSPGTSMSWNDAPPSALTQSRIPFFLAFVSTIANSLSPAPRRPRK